MKALLVSLSLLMTVSAHAVTASTVAVTGKIVSLEANSLVLKVEDKKVQIPKKYLKAKYAVGEVITVAVPEAEFKQLTISKSK